METKKRRKPIPVCYEQVATVGNWSSVLLRPLGVVSSIAQGFISPKAEQLRDFIHPVLSVVGLELFPGELTQEHF